MGREATQRQPAGPKNSKVGFVVLEFRSKFGVEKKLRMREKNDNEPFVVVKESQKGDLVAAEKRNANGRALPKQRRDNFTDIVR